jgi:hypothetical protein
MLRFGLVDWALGVSGRLWGRVELDRGGVGVCSAVWYSVELLESLSLSAWDG